MIGWQKSDCMLLCLYTVNCFRRACIVLLFILMFLCSVSSTYSLQFCTQNDDVTANRSFCLFSQQIIDTVHKPLPPYPLVRGQITLHTLAQCS